jgi:hypothetical protein
MVIHEIDHVNVKVHPVLVSLIYEYNNNLVHGIVVSDLKEGTIGTTIACDLGLC